MSSDDIDGNEPLISVQGPIKHTPPITSHSISTPHSRRGSAGTLPRDNSLLRGSRLNSTGSSLPGDGLQRARRVSSTHTQGVSFHGAGGGVETFEEKPDLNFEKDLLLLEGNSTFLPENYMDVSIWTLFVRRMPWLVGLMMLQSVSSVIMANFDYLIESHVIIASFLTMLLGGGGNTSGQTATAVIRGMGLGQIHKGNLFNVFVKEFILSLFSGGLLGLLAYPRVRYLYNGATDMDALAISICYTSIIVVAVVIGVCVPAIFSMFSDPAVSAPPTIMVLCDIVSSLITCCLCLLILGADHNDDSNNCSTECCDFYYDSCVSSSGSSLSMFSAGATLPSTPVRDLENAAYALAGASQVLLEALHRNASLTLQDIFNLGSQFAKEQQLGL